MSRSSNIECAVKHFGRATGLQHRTCTNWQKAGKISPFQPVPDASSAPQKSFEAFVVHVLAGVLRDNQIGSAILGIKKIEPHPNGPVLYVHPEMANTIATGLLPDFDSDYDGILGIPGLRLGRQGNGRVELVDLSSKSTVFLQHEDKNWRLNLPPDKPGTNQLWRDQNKLIHSERHMLRSWNSDCGTGSRFTRNLLLSRVLRRPRIIDRADLTWLGKYIYAQLLRLGDRVLLWR